MAGNAQQPDLSLPIASSPDQSFTGGSAAALTALPAGPTGLVLVQSLKSNTTNARVSGGTVTTSRGVQLVPGASYTFSVVNASSLKAIVESGTVVLAVSGV